MITTLLHKIGMSIAGLGLVVGSWFGYSPTPSTLPAGGSFQTPDAAALFETTLASKITTTDTTFTLTSATTKDGTTLASSTYGMIIDEGSASEEFVLADCTGTSCANASRGISAVTGTSTVTALKKEHRRGSTVKMTTAPSLIFVINVLKGRQNVENILSYNGAKTFTVGSNQVPSVLYVDNASSSVQGYIDARDAQNVKITGNQTVAGNKTFTGTDIFTATTTFQNGGLMNYSCDVGSDNLALCPKAYIDSVSGTASNANETTKGQVELATKAELALGTSVGGTLARLAIPNSSATSTSQVATTSVVITATTGKIDPTFLNGTAEQYAFNATTTMATTTINSVNPFLFNMRVFTATTSQQTFSVPSGVTRISVKLCAAGGAGGGQPGGGGNSSGGGAGAYVEGVFDVTGSSTIKFNIGGAANGTNTTGTTGGSTQFSSYALATGGIGGSPDSAGSPGGLGGTATATTTAGTAIAVGGAIGQYGVNATNGSISGGGASSQFGGGGKSVLGSSAGLNATGYCSGGGGAGTAGGSTLGGKGADGVVIIYY